MSKKPPPVPEEFRDRCRRAVDEKVLQRWVDEIDIDGQYWLEASKLLAAYGYGKPAQVLSGPDGGPISVSVSAADLTDDELAAIVRGKGSP